MKDEAGIGIPRGIEILVKKAAVDLLFKQVLLDKRSGAAEMIGLALDPTEVAMLDSIPRAQLEKIIAGTKVQPGIRSAFLGYTAAVMLAALGCTTPVKQAVADDINTEGGVRPDIENILTKPSAAFWQDESGKITVKAGVLSGTVKSVDGERVEEPMINLSGVVHDETTGQDVNVNLEFRGDEDGTYLLNPAPAGTFTVSAWGGTYMGQTKQDVVISAGALTTLGFVLTQASPPGGARPDIPPVTRGISPQ
jgi:hypothetical protein